MDINELYQTIKDEIKENEQEDVKDELKDEVKQDEAKDVYLKDIVDIETTSKVVSNLISWTNSRLVIGGYNKIFGKLENFEARNYEQTKEEQDEQAKLIYNLLIKQKLNFKSFIFFISILGFIKNFETPYRAYFQDLRKNKEAQKKVSEKFVNSENQQIKREQQKNKEEKQQGIEIQLNKTYNDFFNEVIKSESYKNLTINEKRKKASELYKKYKNERKKN